MDNREYKRIKYAERKLDVLPYPDENAVKYAEGVTINAVVLNNAFNQLVDNDRHVEN